MSTLRPPAKTPPAGSDSLDGGRPRADGFVLGASLAGTRDVAGAVEAGDVQTMEKLLSRAEARAAWMQDICMAIGEFDRFGEFLEFISERIQRIMDAEFARIFLFDADEPGLWCSTCESEEPLRVPLGQGIVGWVAERGQALNLRAARRDRRFVEEFDAVAGRPIHSMICQPMRDRDGQILGVVQVLNQRDGWFGVDDEGLLAATANTVAVVTQNRSLYLQAHARNTELATLHRRLEDRSRRLEMLHGVHEALLGVSEPEEVLRAVARMLGDMIESAACAVTLVAGGKISEFAYSRASMSDSVSTCARTWGDEARTLAMESGAPVHRRPETQHESPFGAVYCVDPRDGVSSLVAIPLIAGDEVIGTIELINRCRGEDDDEGVMDFSEEDIKLLQLAAADISTAVSRSLEAQARERQGRLSAIGHMLSGVVHDLRTPITISRGYLQLIARSESPERREELAERITSQLELMGGMTQELLAYARGETTLFLRRISLPLLAAELGQFLAHEFSGEGMSVEVETEPRDDIWVDEGKLKRVIFNLARNAREVMQTGGHLGIHFSRHGDTLRIDVSDTGAGIPPEVQSTLFEAFVSASKEGGTGLGLAVVKKLVEEHGGSIRYETEEGVGTTFRVEIPNAFVEPVAG